MKEKNITSIHTFVTGQHRRKLNQTITTDNNYLHDPSLSEDTFRRSLKTHLFALYYST